MIKYDEAIYMIGLTGGSGSGKTLVSDTFKARGIPSIDADKLAREIVEPGKPALAELREYFGDEIIDENGALLRKKLANIAFSDPEKLKNLNRITHAYIAKLMREYVEKYKAEGYTHILYDAPVLIEGGFNKKCDCVVCVLSNKETRIARIMNRDSLSREEAERRIGVQQTDEFYISHSNYVIRNDSDPDEARRQTNEVIDKILASGGDA